MGYGVAPVNFQTAEQWEVQGTNPVHPELEQDPRNVAGELTARSISRLNTIELAAIVFCITGVLLLWFPKAQRPDTITAQTVLLSVMILLYIIYGVFISDKLTELRTLHPFDFSGEAVNASPERKQFDSLHNWYTRLTGITILLLVAQLGIISARFRNVNDTAS